MLSFVILNEVYAECCVRLIVMLSVVVVNVILPSVVAPSTFIAILALSKHHHTHNNQGVLPERERLSTVDLLIKVA